MNDAQTHNGPPKGGEDTVLLLRADGVILRCFGPLPLEEGENFISHLLAQCPDAACIDTFYKLLLGQEQRLEIELIHRKLRAYATGLKPAAVVVTLSAPRIGDSEVLMEAVSSALFKLQVCDEDGLDFIVRSANRRANACLKIPVEHAVGARFLDASTLADNSDVFMFLMDCHERRQVKEDIFLISAAQKRWYHLRAVPLNDSIYLSAVDVTNEKELERNQIEDEARKTIYDLIDHAIHDLNNKFTPIVVYSGMYSFFEEGEVIEPDMLMADMDIISNAVNESVALVRWIRGMSKSEESGKQLYDLARTLRVAEKMFSKFLGFGFSLTVEIAGEVAPIRFPSGQIERIVLNLILNAKQAMPEGGDLVMRLSQERDWVSLAVSDTGVGIKPEVLPHIFEPKFTTKPSGTGMGLHWISTLVSSAGGLINVETKLDEGTRFELRIPAAVDDPIVESLDGGGRRVLVVEDDNFVRPYVLRALSSKGFEAYGADDVVGAEQLGRRHRFDLLIVDAILSNSTGTEVIERLRAHGNDCPVLLMSGYSSKMLIQYGFEPNTPILEKPFTDQTLLKAVHGLLDL